MSNSKYSNSSTQSEAQYEMVQLLKKLTGIDFESDKRFNFGIRSVNIDFYSESHNIIGEAFAHIGKLKSGQADKVASDILKLIYIDKKMNKTHRKVFLIHDATIEKSLKGKSWLSDAIATHEIEIIKVNTNEDTQKLIIETQKNQNMANDPIGK